MCCILETEVCPNRACKTSRVAKLHVELLQEVVTEKEGEICRVLASEGKARV